MLLLAGGVACTPLNYNVDPPPPHVVIQASAMKSMSDSLDDEYKAIVRGRFWGPWFFQGEWVQSGTREGVRLGVFFEFRF